MITEKYCQSCGIPMKVEREGFGFGTEKDGTKSHMYCNMCYNDGEFVDDFKNSDEMVAFVKDVLKKEGMGKFKCWLLTMNIGNLKRWKK